VAVEAAMRAFVLMGMSIAVTIGLAPTAAEARASHSHHAAHTRHTTTRHHRRKATHRTSEFAAAIGCGGAERWDVKDGSDPGAAHVNPTVVSGITIADLNQLPPQAIDADGRMQEEKVIYRITGVLRLFKHETDDNDYHVVIADDGVTPYSTGHSMVVEVPDPQCVAGRHRQFGASVFQPQLKESRSDFEAATQNLPTNRDLGARNIAITIVGVLFFDFMHRQTGHGLPHPPDSQDPNRLDKVVEIHPVLCNDVNRYREQAGKPAC
jgi:hypothetical protein